jgi:lipopolysaccharide/colanic/teichoic acid biosynthesis glycosyltransferase
VHLRGARVLTAESFAETVFGKIFLRDVDEEWVLDRELSLMQNENYARLKLLLDRGMAFLLLLLFLPIFLLISLAILVVDGWPIFYIQKRCGLRSRAFDVFKFRTMKNRKEEGSHYTGEKDDRVTLLGRILRPSRMDELPQLWNILVGDMSLIGPRAEWVKLVEKYETEIPFYHLRHEVPPGLTGWAQVNYPYGSNLEDTREKLRYDLYYIRNHSFLLDFQIVLKTIYVVLAKVGGK